MNYLIGIDLGVTNIFSGLLDQEECSSDVSAAFDQGDALAISIMKYTGAMLGKALSYAVPLFSPDRS